MNVTSLFRKNIFLVYTVHGYTLVTRFANICTYLLASYTCTVYMHILY